MGFLEKIITKRPSKMFGDAKIYFDKEDKKVILIDYKGTYTYLIRDDSKENSYILKTELGDGRCVDCPLKPENLWIIPDIMTIDRSEKIDHVDTDDVSRLLCNLVFEVSSYTILEDPKFKGSRFSNSIVSVIMINPKGDVYAVPYLVAEGVCGCDGNPNGDVMGEAFKFATLGTLRKDGSLFVML